MVRTQIKKPIRIDYYPKTKDNIEEIQVESNLDLDKDLNCEKDLDCKMDIYNVSFEQFQKDCETIKNDEAIDYNNHSSNMADDFVENNIEDTIEVENTELIEKLIKEAKTSEEKEEI